jgi:hypothetical protein
VARQKTTEPHVAIRRRKVSSMLLRGMNAFEIFEALQQGRNALENPETNEPYSHLTITRDITTRCGLSPQVARNRRSAPPSKDPAACRVCRQTFWSQAARGGRSEGRAECVWENGAACPGPSP